MSWRVVGWAVTVKTGSPTRKAVLMALAERHNGDTDQCNPHMERVAEDTELSVRTVERAVTDLVVAGFMEASRTKRADGTWTGYSYTFPRAPSRRPPDTLSGGSPSQSRVDPPDRVSGQELEVDLEPEERLQPKAVVAAAQNGVTAQTVMAEIVDACRADDIPLSSRHRGILARQVDDLLKSGFDRTAVILAAVLSVRRGQPQNAHFIAGDIVAANAGKRLSRREYEKALEDETELANVRRRS